MKERDQFVAVASIALFLLYFVYDIPAAINSSIAFGGSPATAHQVAVLYTAYALPNTVCPLAFGHLHGFIRNGILFILATFVFLGQAIFTTAILMESISLAALGRVFYGIGLESFFVFCESRITAYYAGSELAVATGLFLSIGRLGTVFTFYFSPQTALSYGAIFLCKGGFVLICLAAALMTSLFTYKSPKDEDESEETPVSAPVSDSHLLFLVYQCVFLFGAIWAPFYNIAPLMLQIRFSFSQVEAGRFLGCVEGSSIFLQSLVGLFVDHCGYKLFVVLASALLILVAHANFLLRFASVPVSIGALALAAPMMACYWPCIPKVVSPSQLPMTLSRISCLLNLAYTVSPLVASLLLRISPDYSAAELYICGLICVLLYKIVGLIWANQKLGGGLNEPEISKRCKGDTNQNDTSV
ncbi:hypothetical protein ECANGB1_2773 [Enterospora canceri]|uniref:Lysosomal dipeptide transporter MFSD1 n=1 Tax=Enterospora canceri TaxID=1081671 RepID=A0A1Y1S9J9_9MICR|nr:hypothetical protein ECANGB1_2773 [Enterospora canceri]